MKYKLRGTLLSAALLVSLTACAAGPSAGTGAGPSGGDEPLYGGTITTAAASDPETFDPAACTGATCWNMMRMMFDRLYDYEKATSELKLQAAESFPEVSDDGLTYTIKIKDGLTFSNGDSLTANDVAYSFARVLDPATKAGLAEFWRVIAGSEAYAANPTGLPEGIEVVDDLTIKITLSSPSSAFKYVMAMPAGSLIPEGSGSTIGSEPVGSGPFVLASFEPGKEIVLDRNDSYWDSPRPYVDNIRMLLNVDPDNQVLMLQKGDIDLMGSPIPPAKFIQLSTDPAFKDRLIKIEKPSSYFLSMNVNTPPFDNPKVREAVSYAFDRNALIKLISGEGKPSTEFLPPNVLGHTGEKMTHDQDIDKAKLLLAEAGFPDGFQTEFYAWNVPPFSGVAPQIQQDLKAIGIDVKLETLAPNTFFELLGAGKAPMALDFWVADFPEGSDFLQALLSCASAVPDGTNSAFYCNPEMDALVSEALAQTDPAASEAKYKEASELMLSENPVVPLYFGTKTEIVGENVGGYFPQPIWGWDIGEYWKLDGTESR
ncbi:ABC transporter substrate-binding protein [Salinibacterium sp. SWN1162]|uniref:ABC transporter substrate-binding protein n=1 Tax=Salinibacterium sp. SWN1162 TaxID=2792053 RepID=UPI0018CF5919|nr:ABC transporter substrate-binding protein [Salinibacterium sp. SWN1162]MBH0008681.1 ABC transporter substrate-binding protein [Salinibacterium sp. SWN1162]